MAEYAGWSHWLLKGNTSNNSHTSVCISSGWQAEYPALSCCPNAAVLVLYPVLWYSAHLHSPVPLVLPAVTTFLLQLCGAWVLGASYAAALFLSASEAPCCLQDNSAEKQSCGWCGKSMSLGGMTLWWGEESLGRDPAPLWKLYPR